PTQAIIDAYKWVDYVVVGQFDSPQFFPRTATADGNYHLADDASDPTKPNWGTGKLARNPDGSLIDPPLPLYKQIFDLDPVTGAAFTRHETVTFWMSVPKGRNGKPAPVVFLGHGYTSTKLEAVAYMGYFASMGFATVAMDCVSHGLDVDGTEVK